MTSPTDKDLRAIWVASKREVFAVGGDGLVFQYDGIEWKLFSGPNTAEPFVGIWGSSPSDLFIISLVGTNGTIFHFANETWDALPLGLRLLAIWGVSPTDVFVTSGDTTPQSYVQRFDGQDWTSTSANTIRPLSAIWGRNANDVLAVGTGGVIQQFNGSSWQASPNTPIAGLSFYGVWVSSTGRAFAVGTNGSTAIIATKDGNTWNSEIGPTTNLFGVWGLGDDDVYAVGEGGTILHRAAGMWNTMSPVPTGNRLAAVQGTEEEVFAVGAGGTILRLTR